MLQGRCTIIPWTEPFICRRMPASNISHDRLPATLPDGHPRAGWPHVWIAIPFYAMYLVALAGNTTLILVIVTDSALHAPMYLFLGLLSLTDLTLSSTTMPKTLAIFCFQAGELPFDGCLAQMFCVHSVYALDSSVPLPWPLIDMWLSATQ